MNAFKTIREALNELDRLESNATCNDFDKAQGALAALNVVESVIATAVSDLESGISTKAVLEDLRPLTD